MIGGGGVTVCGAETYHIWRVSQINMERLDIAFLNLDMVRAQTLENDVIVSLRS